MSVRFKSPAEFASQSYQLLPFRFSQLDDGNYFLSTDYGEWMCISPSQLTTLINKEKIEDETLWYELKAKHMVSNGIDGLC